jgi:hypothetical protein
MNSSDVVVCVTERKLILPPVPSEICHLTAVAPLEITFLHVFADNFLFVLVSLSLAEKRLANEDHFVIIEAGTYGSMTLIQITLKYAFF